MVVVRNLKLAPLSFWEGCMVYGFLLRQSYWGDSFASCWIIHVEWLKGFQWTLNVSDIAGVWFNNYN